MLEILLVDDNSISNLKKTRHLAFFYLFPMILPSSNPMLIESQIFLFIIILSCLSEIFLG
jgi:hypothetical protein